VTGLHDEAGLPPERPAGVDFAPTATADGEPVLVERIPSDALGVERMF
jgi:hypothetical protein